MKIRLSFSTLLPILICLLGSLQVHAQAPNTSAPNTSVPSSDTTKYLVVKYDGNEYVGLILSDDGREVLIETKSLGKIYIPKSDIKLIRPIDYAEDMVNGVVSSADVFTTRYQFTTNCFPIKKGENYAMVNLYGPEVHFAVHKDFSVGVMATWVGSPIGLALKYTRGTANPKINYGVGTLLGTSGYFNLGKGYGGLHWGMITYGDRRNNATLSVGYGYFNPRMSNTNFGQPIYTPGVYAAPNGMYPELPIDGYFYASDQSNYKAPIIGLAGQAKVGKKASFIYDCMYIMASNSYKSVTGGQPRTEQYDANGLLSQVEVYNFQETVTAGTSRQNVMVIMPGMRFQRSENKAFQISLAGVLTKSMSFPLPMVSWFYRFS
jgi:hypothetical protein